MNAPLMAVTAAEPRHFLDLWRLDGATIRALLDEAGRRKAARMGWTQGRVDADAPAAGHTPGDDF